MVLAFDFFSPCHLVSLSPCHPYLSAAGRTKSRREAGIDNPRQSAGRFSSPRRSPGTLKTADTVTRIVAVDRPFADVLQTSLAVPKDPFLYEGTYDPKTQAFTIPNLLPGRTYDLIIWTENAAHDKIRWEGASMDYHRPILPAPAEQPFSPEDQKWLEDFVKEMPAFYDKSRILHLAADHKHAVVLVELGAGRGIFIHRRMGRSFTGWSCGIL